MFTQLLLDVQTSLTAVDTMPGQSYPAEAQCHALLGSCGRSYPESEHDCSQLLCTNTNGVSVLSFAFNRLDGTYCGSGKVYHDSRHMKKLMRQVCVEGACVAVPQVTLTPVNGGWSPWVPSVCCVWKRCKRILSSDIGSVQWW